MHIKERKNENKYPPKDLIVTYAVLLSDGMHSICQCKNCAYRVIPSVRRFCGMFPSASHSNRLDLTVDVTTGLVPYVQLGSVSTECEASRDKTQSINHHRHHNNLPTFWMRSRKSVSYTHLTLPTMAVV